MIYVSEPVPICENHAQICSKNKQNNWIFEYFIYFYANFSTLTLHFKDIEAPDRCSGDLGPCVLGNFVAI